MSDLFDLTGKVAIVTGGSRGLGKSFAKAMASAGANVAIVARTKEALEATAGEISKEYGVRVIPVQADVKNQDSVRTMVDTVAKELGGINILINNAGINIRKQPEEYEIWEWDEVLSINLRSAFLCSQAVYPFMKAAGGGKIISVGSMATLFGGNNLAPYASSKGGIVQLTRSLATSWGKDNIQANSILPGWLNTDLLVTAMRDNPVLKERILGRTPLGRCGEPEDLTGIAIFLASSASNFVTGTAIPLDGGYSVMI